MYLNLLKLNNKKCFYVICLIKDGSFFSKYFVHESTQKLSKSEHLKQATVQLVKPITFVWVYIKEL